MRKLFLLKIFLSVIFHSISDASDVELLLLNSYWEHLTFVAKK